MRLHRSWGPPRPRWSHEPAGGRAAPQTAPLKEAPGTAENHSPPWQGPCKALRNRTPSRPWRPCTWRSPGTCHLLRLPVPLPQPGPSSKPENHREPPLWSVLPSCWASLPTPSEGMLSTRKGGGREEQRWLPMPLQTQAQRVTEAQPTWAPFRAVPASAPAREPPAPACLLCGLTRLPVPAPHLCACTPPPQSPSQEAL